MNQDAIKVKVDVNKVVDALNNDWANDMVSMKRRFALLSAENEHLKAENEQLKAANEKPVKKDAK